MTPSSFCGGPYATNGYWIENGGQSILFDAPEGISEHLASEGHSVDLLILTHLHHDHILDVQDVIKRFDCPIWAHSSPTDELILRGGLKGFEINRHLSEKDQVTCGELEFQILHIPGHSPDSLCFYEANKQIVIGGDVLFQNSIGRTDFPNGSHSDLISGIKEKLLTLPEDTTIFPGHGPKTLVGFEKQTNPFLQGN